jgi:hypothetical protein
MSYQTAECALREMLPRSFISFKVMDVPLHAGQIPDVAE